MESVTETPPFSSQEEGDVKLKSDMEMIPETSVEHSFHSQAVLVEMDRFSFFPFQNLLLLNLEEINISTHHTSM
jgi:hypothetical protein